MKSVKYLWAVKQRYTDIDKKVYYSFVGGCLGLFVSRKGARKYARDLRKTHSFTRYKTYFKPVKVKRTVEEI